MKNLILIGCFWCSTIHLFAQSPLEWVQQLGDKYQDIVTAIVTDTAGNIYGVGDFLDTLDNFISYGSKDIICFKYSTDKIIKQNILMNNFFIKL